MKTFWIVVAAVCAVAAAGFLVGGRDGGLAALSAADGGPAKAGDGSTSSGARPGRYQIYPAGGTAQPALLLDTQYGACFFLQQDVKTKAWYWEQMTFLIQGETGPAHAPPARPKERPEPQKTPEAPGNK